MKFTLDADLYDGVPPAREREWRQALLDLNLDYGAMVAPESDVTLRFDRRVDGGVDIHVTISAQTPRVVSLSWEMMKRHFRDYRDVIIRLSASASGSAPGARDFEALDYAKKLVHDDAAEALQEAFGGILELNHRLARRVFTLVFLVSSALPEHLVTQHRHR